MSRPEPALSPQTPFAESSQVANSGGRGVLARTFILCTLKLTLLPVLVTVLFAQDTRGDNQLQPIFVAGATLGVVDLWEDNVTEMGYSARGGIRWRGTEVSAVVDHWRTSQEDWDALSAKIV